MSDFRSKGPELLVDLTEHVAAALGELVSMDDEAARHVANEVADRMAAHWGGQNVYFPMGLAGKLSRRDRQIYEEFNGTNQSDLARKWGCRFSGSIRSLKRFERTRSRVAKPICSPRQSMTEWGVFIALVATVLHRLSQFVPA